MLRIQRSSGKSVVLSLSGHIEKDDVAELQRLLKLEPAGQSIALDLEGVTLVDREALRFLALCQTQGIGLENCPGYIRKWIDTDRS
jgi:hypothetical protein